MDDSGEILSTESHAPAARADETETDVVSELTSKKNDPDKTLHLSSQSSVSPSGTEDEKTNQQCIKDTADLDFVHDSITDDSRNETLVEDDTEMCEVPDTTLNTDDLLINSNPTDSITETIKGSKSDQKTEKISQFPLGRVRDIMKADPDIKVVSAECVFLVAKATVSFNLVTHEVPTSNL